MASEDDYGLSPAKETRTIEPPSVDYLPPRPRNDSSKIGLIGAGKISELHLKNYRDAGFKVVAIASRKRSDAIARRDQFFPHAAVYSDYHALLSRDDITVVDITPHPDDRLPILRHAIQADKHVLSQKPFVLELETGAALVQLASDHNVKLAVNQNGRWAPHFSYFRNAIAAGLIGSVTSIDCSLQWDQTWIAGQESFERIEHLILFDFGIHWFDIAHCLMGGQTADIVFAATTRFDGQCFRPAAVATAVIQYPNAQVRLSFNGHTRLGEQDVTTVVGTKGTLRSRGLSLNSQPTMDVYLPQGQCSVPLSGCWFESGFQGAMGELLCAIEEDREPIHSATDNLRSLELCFAAIRSADQQQVVKVGSAHSS